MNKWNPSWCLIRFDLPTDTKTARAAARRFVRDLSHGVLPCHKQARGGRGMALVMRPFDTVCETMSRLIPPDGEVRVTPLTDAQMSHTRIFDGQRRPMGQRNT